MEFDEMKKIWDSQNNELLYGINEQALHNRILSKKNQALHITNFSELLSIIVYTVAGCFIFGITFAKQNGNVFMYLLSAWILITALYCLLSRVKRIKGDYRYNRSMHGDLDHAIAVATYQTRFSLLMRWNLLPFSILILLGVWDGEKSVWIALGIIVFFVLTNYAAGWEHAIYKSRKRELEILKGKLENEMLNDRPS